MANPHPTAQPDTPPSFDRAFRDRLSDLLRWRRDVRHFSTEPVDPAMLDRCLTAFQLAPSVGLSEPWRIVRVESPAMRDRARANFEETNAKALQGYAGDRAKLYSGLKLAGMREAPVQLAVFSAEGTDKGAGLGAGTMPEMRAYSVVTAIAFFWLALRSEGLGLGWVSILDAPRLSHDLEVPPDWRLVAYLCIGHPLADDCTPELERVGWEKRADRLDILIR